MSNRKNKKGKTKSNKQNSVSKLCLNMIVRNEAHEVNGVQVIRRCLDNVGHLLDAIAIVDTGSTDETINIIILWADEKKIPCEVLVDPWIDDFAYSRTKALRHGENVIEKIKRKQLLHSPDDGDKVDWYFLFMDADNVAFADDGVSPIQVNKTQLGDDSYEVQMRQGHSHYGYIWLVRVCPEKQWQWYSPRHEYIVPVKDDNRNETWKAKQGKIEGGYIESRREGDRSKDTHKYLRDAIVFEKALIDDPMNDRYLYYVAQSYQDAARAFNEKAQVEKEKAANNDLSQVEKSAADNKYKQLIQKGAVLWERAEKAFAYRALVPPFHLWNDEYTYMALIKAGIIRNYRKGGKYDTKCLEYFAKAHQKRPHRLEAAHYLLNYYLKSESFRVGWAFAKDLVRIPYPKDEHIFVDKDIHNYSFMFNASLCAYYADAKDDFINLSKLVMRNPSTPDNIREAAKRNLDRFSK